MYMTKKKLEEVRQKYGTTLLGLDEAVAALSFAHDVLCAEADAIKEKEPGATASIARLEQAAYEVFSIGGEIENEEFGFCEK